MTKITEFLEILLEGGDLSFAQSKELLDTIFDGDVADVQIAAFLAAMRMKKATADEIAGLARSLRNHAVKVAPKVENTIDTCGSGGAAIKTFNISTASAFVAAGAGAFVAKHGNRGITSKCGSADVLEKLGVKIDCGPDVIAECIERAHIGFMFAPMHHPAMKFVQPIRKSLDFRTAFNILGPLANPAAASAQVMGVAEPALMERIADTLDLLGVKRAMVVHSGGLDEISLNSPTDVIELKNGSKNSYQIQPSDFGFSACSSDEIVGKDIDSNAALVSGVICGKNTGPARDIVLLNSAAAIMVASLAENMNEAIKKAAESIDSGAAEGCLEKMVEISNRKG